jgi:[ribosomal protein S5]-alanine N-acetyltransferase
MNQILSLRAPLMTDADGLTAMVDERVVPFTRLPYPFKRRHAVYWIRKRDKCFVRRVIVDVENNALVGAISLLIDKHNTAELGYWLGYSYWGRGFATAAVREMLELGFEMYNIRKIFAEVSAPNYASARVLQKCGMKKEAVLLNHTLRDGQISYVDVFATVK